MKEKERKGKKRKGLKIDPVGNGTVLDRIKAGQSLNVLHVIGIKKGTTLGFVMNVDSKKMGKKDIIMIEGVELDPEQVNKIALISPDTTINIIRNSQVAEKVKVKLPEKIIGLIKCPNLKCVTNATEPEPKEPVIPKAIIEGSQIICFYCEEIIKNVAEQIIY